VTNRSVVHEGQKRRRRRFPNPCMVTPACRYALRSAFHNSSGALNGTGEDELFIPCIGFFGKYTTP